MLTLPLWFGSCNRGGDQSIPVLSPKASMEKMQLEDGFSIKLVASEPLISTPVCMTFDDSGRIWVVEMSDYHPIKEDSTQQYPLGKVVILEDKDHDGVMDSRKLFLDSLVMPRAICLVDGGVLVGTPPNLWYYAIDQDKPGRKTLVDSAYTVSNNPEGQTNGLMRSIDNWIYSAGFGSSKRYRRINGHWVTQKTFLRGQWGVSQDNEGHLFYNNNSQNLLGDYFLPGVTHGNLYQKRVAGFNQKIIEDNRVYPAGPTPGVNRGYREGILDSTKRLVNFTAACGPLIYRGGIFPAAYAGNAFVCEPAAYLVKRNILRQQGVKITGEQAYQGKEFLRSLDKRFRPVSLYDGPDGALYLVDMYRGVIQDALSITDYLKDYSLKHGLNAPVNCGRIYKIFPKKAALDEVKIPDDPAQLVTLLRSKNGWVRDRAQERIVDRQYRQLVPELRQLLDAGDVLTSIHAFWTLQGLDALQQADIVGLLNSSSESLRQQSLTALIGLLDKGNYNDYLPMIRQLASQNDSLLAPYLAYTAGAIYPFSPQTAEQLWGNLLKTYPHNAYVTDAIIGGIQDKEAQFVARFQGDSLFHKHLARVLANKAKIKSAKNLASLKNKYPDGYAVYTGTCQTCHGADGNGIEFVAPPLNGSNWVAGDKHKLIAIVLYGLSGPVQVNHKMYKKPQVTGEMPGFGNNKFSDKTLAEIISFIRQSWNNTADPVDTVDIAQVRKTYPGRDQSFSMEELMGSGK